MNSLVHACLAVRASYWRSRFCASPALETRAYPMFMSYTVVCDEGRDYPVKGCGSCFVLSFLFRISQPCPISERYYMPHRTILTNHQRASLFDLPTDEAVLVSIMSQAPRTWCILRRRRHPQNRLGFALRLCVFRYPGRLIQLGGVIPEAMPGFIGGQLGITSTASLDYGAREATRLNSSAFSKSSCSKADDMRSISRA